MAQVIRTDFPPPIPPSTRAPDAFYIWFSGPAHLSIYGAPDVAHDLMRRRLPIRGSRSSFAVPARRSISYHKTFRRQHN